MCRCLHVVDPTSNLYTIDPATASPRNELQNRDAATGACGGLAI